MTDLEETCRDLCVNANAVGVLLVDEDLCEIARHGDCNRVDLAQLASLREEAESWPQLDRDLCLYTLGVGECLLAVIYDSQSSLGLVRLRSKKAAQRLREILAHGPSGGGSSAPAGPQLN
jgi:hypothetical protein